MFNTNIEARQREYFGDAFGPFDEFHTVLAIEEIEYSRVAKRIVADRLAHCAFETVRVEVQKRHTPGVFKNEYECWRVRRIRHIQAARHALHKRRFSGSKLTTQREEIACAAPSNDGTLTIFQSRACANVFAADKPMRSPVHEPGPRPTAMASISSSVQPAA